MTSDWVDVRGSSRSSSGFSWQRHSGAAVSSHCAKDPPGEEEETRGCGPARARGEGGGQRTRAHAVRSPALITALCLIMLQLFLAARPACGGAGWGSAQSRRSPPPRPSGAGRMVSLRGGEQSSSEFDLDRFDKKFTWRDMTRIMVLILPLHPVVHSSLIGLTLCIVKSFRSRRSFISSPLWTPAIQGPPSSVYCRFSLPFTQNRHPVDSLTKCGYSG